MIKVNPGSSFEKQIGGSQVPDAVYQVSKSSASWFRKRFLYFFTIYGHGHVTWNLNKFSFPTSHARPPIHLLHRIYQWDKTFCSLFLKTKFSNRAILYGDTLIELLKLISVFNKYVTRQFKMCCRGEKRHFFQLQHRF